MLYRIAALASLSLLVSATVQAQNVVIDPGFESAAPGLHLAGSGPPFPADLGDGAWTTTAGGVSVANASSLAHTGSNSLDLAPGDPGAIQQTVSTTAGQHYDLSFFATTSLESNSLIVTFGGTPVFSQPIPRQGLGTAQYRQFTVLNLLASSPSTTLGFAGNAGVGDLFIDDISVTIHPSATVPEPGSLGLLIGLSISGGVYFVGHRNRGRKAA